MKKLLLILLCLPMIGFGQDNEQYINGYKYIVINDVTSHKASNLYIEKCKKLLISTLKDAGFNVLSNDSEGFVGVEGCLKI